MIPFLITGLPRSRTTWMSEVCTIPGQSMCSHEVSLGLQSIADLAEYYNSQGEKYVGVSDSHLSQILPEILSVIPMKTLVILRPVEDVKNSLEKKRLNPSSLDVMNRGLLESISHPLVQAIDFYDLDDSEIVYDCLSWLMPDIKIPKDWVEDFQSKIVEEDHISSQALASTNPTFRNLNA